MSVGTSQSSIAPPFTSMGHPPQVSRPATTVTWVCVCGGGGACAVEVCIVNMVFNTVLMVIAGLNLQVVCIDRGSVYHALL